MCDKLPTNNNSSKQQTAYVPWLLWLVLVGWLSIRTLQVIICIKFNVSKKMERNIYWRRRRRRRRRSHKFGKFEQQQTKWVSEWVRERQNDESLWTMENNFAKNILLLIQHTLNGGRRDGEGVCMRVYYMHMNHSILCWLAKNWLANWLDTNLTHSLTHSLILPFPSIPSLLVLRYSYELLEWTLNIEQSYGLQLTSSSDLFEAHLSGFTQCME